MNTKFILLLLFISISSKEIISQTLNVDSGGVFYLSSGTSFTSQDIVNVDDNGLFKIQAGTNWTNSAEFVNGKITVSGAGSTVVNIGDINQSTVTVTTATDDNIVCDYAKSTPTGSLDTTLSNYALSDTEYWSVSKSSGSSSDVSVSGLTGNASATYSGANASSGNLIVVRFNTTNNQWEAYSGSTGFGDFAIAQNQSALNTEDIFTANFSLYPNPVKKGNDIYFKTPPFGVSDIMITIFDSLGKKIQQYNTIITQNNKVELNTKNFKTGLYLVQFSINKKEQTFTKKIIVK